MACTVALLNDEPKTDLPRRPFAIKKTTVMAVKLTLMPRIFYPREPNLQYLPEGNEVEVGCIS